MAMNNNKWKSLREIPWKRDPGKAVLLEIDPRKRSKSDLTVAFLNSSLYVRTLARQFSRTDKIDRMRQSAVSNQWATPVSRYGSMIPTNSQLEAIKKQSDDPTEAHAIARLSPSPSLGNSLASGRKLSRTMTSGSFKKKYSGLLGQTQFGRKTFKPDSQKTMLERRVTKSQFCFTPEPQASGNDQLSLGDSWEEEDNQLPELDEFDEDEQDEQDEQEMKSQKSNRIVEEVSDTDDQESDIGQEIKYIDEETEGNASRD
jgi:hypothetical protein